MGNSSSSSSHIEEGSIVMSNINKNECNDTLASGAQTNMDNWHQRNVLETSAKDNIAATESPTHLGNWYERNVLRGSPRGISARAR